MSIPASSTADFPPLGSCGGLPVAGDQAVRSSSPRSTGAGVDLGPLAPPTPRSGNSPVSARPGGLPTRLGTIRPRPCNFMAAHGVVSTAILSST